MSNFLNQIGEDLLQSQKIQQTVKDSWKIGSTVFFITKQATIGEGQIVDVEGGRNNEFFVEVEKTNNSFTNRSSFLENDRTFKANSDTLYASFDEIEAVLQNENKKEVKAWTLQNTNTVEHLTDKNVYKKAVEFTKEFLTSNFEMRGRYEVTFNNLKNASFKEGGLVDKADILLSLNFKTISGVKVKTELMLPLRKGSFVEPSVLFFNGNSRILAQTTLDDIASENSFVTKLSRNPERTYQYDILQKYLNTTYPKVQRGLFELE